MGWRTFGKNNERSEWKKGRSRSWIYTKHEEAVKAFEQGNEEFLNRWVIEQMNNSEQIEKLENVKIKINYIDKSYRRTVNGKLLRELYPDAFRECTNRSEVQPHLRVQMVSA